MNKWEIDKRIYTYKNEPPFPDGTIIYFSVINGFAGFHRLDGPARIYPDGKIEWWIYDDLLDCSSQEEFERYLKLKAFL